MDNYALADSLMQKVLQIRNTRMPANRQAITQAISGLANIRLLEGEYAQALSLAEQALDIRKDELGKSIRLMLNR